MNRQKIFFDHMAKTGGSTVYNVLKAGLGDEAVTSQLILGHRDLLQRYGWKRVISAHTRFQYDDEFDPGRYYCTVLREPLDRALSNYWFARGMDSCANWSGMERVRLAQTYGFDDLVMSEDRTQFGWFSNVQARHYAELTLPPGSDPGEEGLLDAAKAALERFDLVGVNGELEDFLLILAADCAVPLSGEMPFFNVTHRRQRVAELAAPVQARLAALNAVDLELFRHAQALFRRQRRDRLRVMVAAGGQPHPGAAAAPESPAPLPPVRRRDLGGQLASIDALAIQGGMSGAGALYSGDIAALSVQFSSREDLDGVILRIAILDDGGLEVFSVASDMLGWRPAVDRGKAYQASYDFRNDLAPGTYYVSAALCDAAGSVLHAREFGLAFEVLFMSGFYFDGLVNLNPRLQIACDGAVCPRGDVPLFPGMLHHGAASVDLAEFAAEVRALAEPGPVMPGELFSLAVEVANRSRQTWVSNGSRPVQLGYRWFGQDGRELAVEGLRTRLPRDLRPGDSLPVFVHVQSPAEAGRYNLRICPVQEYVAWFDDQGGGFLELSLDVTHAAS
jgi:hypothetical protein